MSSLKPLPQRSVVRQRRQQVSELQFDKFPSSTIIFGFEKFDSKTQATTCSDFPSEDMFRIKEVEMVYSWDETRITCSIRSKDWRYRTHNTDLLNLDENKFDYKKNCV